MPEYDKTTHAPGRSREVDAIAHAAAAEDMTKVKANDEDPANTHVCPQGNPEDPGYSRTRSIPATK